MPTYPFERERFWLDPLLDVSDAAQLRFHLPNWQATPSPRLQGADTLRDAGVWLVITDGSALAVESVQRLRAAQAEVIVAAGGESIEPLRGKTISRLLYFAPSTPAMSSSVTDAQSLARAVANASLGLLKVAQIAHGNTQHDLTIAAVTSRLSPDLQLVTDLATETLAVLARVMSQEWPTAKTMVIDLPATREAQPYAAWLLSEVCTANDGQLVAYRGGRRLVRSFEELQLDAQDAAPPLRHNGRYLITGGLGSIGLALAEMLAQQYQARLLLVSRSGLPDPASCDSILEASAPSNELGARSKRIRAIEARGSLVRIAALDVTDVASLSQAVATAEKAWGGSIDGVFHLAGALDDASVQVPISALRAEQQQRQLHPKVGGALALEQVFRDRHLEFAALFSSTAALLGGVGFGAYATANAAMDALASSGRCCGNAAWLALNWDAWEAHPTAAGSATISVVEGINALLRALALGNRLPQIVITKGSLAERLSITKAKSVPAALSAPSAAEPAPAAPRANRPAIGSEFVAARTDLERLVVEIWEASLGVSGIGIHDDFFELGGDSLSMMGVTAKVTETLNVEVPLRIFLNSGRTAAAFAALIITRLAKLQDSAVLQELASLDGGSDQLETR